MIYTHDTFLKLISDTDRNLEILNINGITDYTINVYFINATFIDDNLLKIGLKTGKTITIPFSSINESKMALNRMQIYIDRLRDKDPIYISPDVKKYVDYAVSNSLSGPTGPTGPSIIFYNFSHGQIDPMDSQSYYIGDLTESEPSTISTKSKMVKSMVDGYIINITIMTYIAGEIGSSEIQKFKIKNTTTNDYRLITDSYRNLSPSQLDNFTLDDRLRINTGDELEIIWENPDYEVSPISVKHNFNAYIIF